MHTNGKGGGGEKGCQIDAGVFFQRGAKCINDVSQIVSLDARRVLPVSEWERDSSSANQKHGVGRGRLRSSVVVYA